MNKKAAAAPTGRGVKDIGAEAWRS